eukprot:scaffold270675_cov37-Prasinocladus_malaysianus.AAC.1
MVFGSCGRAVLVTCHVFNNELYAVRAEFFPEPSKYDYTAVTCCRRALEVRTQARCVDQLNRRAPRGYPQEA